MPKLISFFGTLGSGKTIRAKLLSNFLGLPLYSEIADSPFLEDMFLYGKNALLNQLHFLYRNRNQILINYDINRENVLIFDYYIAQVDAFSYYFLNNSEYKEFSNHYKAIIKELPLPDFIIFLNIDYDLNLVRIKMRERYYEKVSKEFVNTIQKKIYEHLNLIKKKTNVLEIDASLDIKNCLETRMKFLNMMINNLPSNIKKLVEKQNNHSSELILDS